MLYKASIGIYVLDMQSFSLLIAQLQSKLLSTVINNVVINRFLVVDRNQERQQGGRFGSAANPNDCRTSEYRIWTLYNKQSVIGYEQLMVDL